MPPQPSKWNWSSLPSVQLILLIILWMPVSIGMNQACKTLELIKWSKVRPANDDSSTSQLGQSIWVLSFGINNNNNSRHTDKNIRQSQGWIFYKISNNFSPMICGNFSPKLYATQTKSLQVDKLFPNLWHFGGAFPRYLSGNFVKYSPLDRAEILGSWNSDHQITIECRNDL